MISKDKLRGILTPTQYKYWIEYFYNNHTLADISIMYDVHISTVCHVLKNARKRYLSYVERG